MVDPQLHRTALRVLEILELIAQYSEGLNFTSISTKLSIPKSSLHPLLYTLCHKNYIHFNESTQHYHMGESLYLLGQLYVKNVNVLQLIQEQVTQLSHKLNETSFFGVLSGSDITYLAKGEPDTPIRFVTAYVGTKNPAYSTGLGKAILMNFTKEKLEDIISNNWVVSTPNTIKSLDELYQQLQIMKTEGFAYEKEESTPGIQCIAVPICHGNKPIAGLSVSVPVYRFSESKSKLIKSEIMDTKKLIEKTIDTYYDEWSNSISNNQ